MLTQGHENDSLVFYADAMSPEPCSKQLQLRLSLMVLLSYPGNGLMYYKTPVCFRIDVDDGNVVSICMHVIVYKCYIQISYCL